MSYKADNPETFDGQTVGNGQCVAFVKAASGAPASKLWKAGKKVLDAAEADLPAGIAIATFDKDGNYPNNPSGNHAAILIRRNGKMITVWDQWSGQPVHKRDIADQVDSDNWSNDSSRFSIIEDARKLLRSQDGEIDKENCSHLGAVPPSEYGKIGLDVATPSWAARLTSHDHLGVPITSSLGADAILPLKGLSHFYGLEIAFAYPQLVKGTAFGGPVGEVSFFFVSRAGNSLSWEVFDMDDQFVKTENIPFTPGQAIRVVIAYPGIGRLRISRWPEAVLDTVCARVLAPLD